MKYCAHINWGTDGLSEGWRVHKIFCSPPDTFSIPPKNFPSLPQVQVISFTIPVALALARPLNSFTVFASF